ncbi:hypothetical protein DHEL01_v205702 [Diaporthe helianthi]|uniref:Uncharacterized protein n=1 Tax=Diaporthe helianthi TaxID=158607 RepID=A0A2P5I098_DIAHE|nr:hypothetical protein DHEL01_v205702 [Diaporthe helianthi]
MTNSSLFTFSDEFKEWAKQEDMVNNQMNTNWIPAYVIITLIPIGFIVCAALASRKETKRQAATGTDEHEDGNKSIELSDLEAGLAKGKGPATTMATIEAAAAAAAVTAETGTTPTYPPRTRTRADSLGSDTGAVIGEGASQRADGDSSQPRRQQRRRTLIGRQNWAQESAVAGPSSSSSSSAGRREGHGAYYLAECPRVMLTSRVLVLKCSF